MALQLTIVAAGDEPLPAGSPLRIELRDTSYADAPAKLLKRVDTTVARRGRTTTVSVPLDAEVPDGATVWAHNDVDRDGRVSSGDFLSMESYPVTSAAQKITIRLRRVK